MKIALSISLVLIACFSVTAQVNTACPKITVQGPASLTFAGNSMTFTVSADRALPPDSKFEWAVSTAKIESGQGTPSIQVRTPNNIAQGNIKATVKVTGLPNNCQNDASETAGYYLEFVPTAEDNYGRLSKSDEKARLQVAFEQLGKQPDIVALIKIQVPKTGKITYASRVQAINSALAFLRLDKNRIIFVNDGTGELSTTIYLVPRDAAASFGKP